MGGDHLVIGRSRVITFLEKKSNPLKNSSRLILIIFQDNVVELQIN